MTAPDGDAPVRLVPVAAFGDDDGETHLGRFIYYPRKSARGLGALTVCRTTAGDRLHSTTRITCLKCVHGAATTGAAYDPALIEEQ